MRLRELRLFHPSPVRPSLEEQNPPRLSVSQRRSLKWSRRLSHAMDRQWGIGPWHFGVESVVDLVPVLGDVISGGASAYQLWVASQLKLSRGNRVRMLVNVGVDLGLGVVPVVGDFFDTFFKVHVRNQQIIDRHLERQGLKGM